MALPHWPTGGDQAHQSRFRHECALHPGYNPWFVWIRYQNDHAIYKAKIITRGSPQSSAPPPSNFFGKPVPESLDRKSGTSRLSGDNILDSLIFIGFWAQLCRSGEDYRNIVQPWSTKNRPPAIAASLFTFRFNNSRLWMLWVHEVVDEILNILAIHAEDTTGASAVAIQTEGGHTSDDISVT